MRPFDFYLIRVKVLGLTQRAMGAELGKNDRTVRYYENGDGPIPFLVAQRMIELALAARPSTTAPASTPPSGPASRTSYAGE